MSEMIPVGNSQPANPLAIPGIHGDAGLLQATRSRLATSLDIKIDAERELLQKALTDIDESGRDSLGKTLDVVHFVLRDARRRETASGELVACLMLILICADGTTWSTTSEWAIESFHLLSSLSKYPPWNPARRLLVKEVRTHGGFSTYKLVDAVQATASNGKKGGAK